MDQERLARVEEQLKWMAPRVERIEGKLDILAEKSAFNWGKIIGACLVFEVIISAAMELLRH